jgi:hypothetical protein
LPSHVACKLLALFNRRSSYDFSSARHLVSLVRCVSALAFMLSFTRRVGPGLCLFSSSSCSAISLLQFIDLLWFV